MRAGTVSLPTIVFGNASHTGVYLKTHNRIGFAVDSCDVDLHTFIEACVDRQHLTMLEGFLFQLAVRSWLSDGPEDG